MAAPDSELFTKLECVVHQIIRGTEGRHRGKHTSHAFWCPRGREHCSSKVLFCVYLKGSTHSYPKKDIGMEVIHIISHPQYFSTSIFKGVTSFPPLKDVRSWKWGERTGHPECFSSSIFKGIASYPPQKMYSHKNASINLFSLLLATNIFRNKCIKKTYL